MRAMMRLLLVLLTRAAADPESRHLRASAVAFAHPSTGKLALPPTAYRAHSPQLALPPVMPSAARMDGVAAPVGKEAGSLEAAVAAVGHAAVGLGVTSDPVVEPVQSTVWSNMRAVSYFTAMVSLTAFASVFAVLHSVRWLAGRAPPRETVELTDYASPLSPLSPTAVTPAAFTVATEEQAEQGKEETYEFEAEVTKVMDIIINSLYSDKDIFLRELVSNASDACDKKRFLSLTDEKAFNGRIRVLPDKEGNTLTIEDNGVGLTRKELKENLGRIAASGTKKFTEALRADADATNLIGQFGVGFYSAFLVADKVTVVTKAEGGEQLRWESTQASSYTISADTSEEIEGTGTRLILSLKEDADKYLDDYTLRDMLKRYSEFISFPIEIFTQKTEYETVPDPDAEAKEGEPPPTKSVPKTTEVWDQVNVAQPIWMRSPKDVTPEEYQEFYKNTFSAYDTLDGQTHFSLEGQVEFRALLFLPSTVPWELSQDMFSDKAKTTKLYVKRVFISDSFGEELLPRWLCFLKGLVDSEDLPLNVSREILQKSRVLSIIKKRLVRKAIDMLKEASKDPEKSKRLSQNFSRYLKVGVIEDQDNKEALLDLASFATTSSDAAEGTTLPQYIERMPEGQTSIYYVTSTSKAAAASSPALEGMLEKGYEVLVALDQIDEIALQGVGKYKDFEVLDAAKENVSVQSDEEKAEVEKAQQEFQKMCQAVKEVLGPKVDKVVISSRLKSSPSALVQPQWGMSPQMQRFMKAQAAAAGDADTSQMPGMSAANLELNPSHPVVLQLKAQIEGEEADVSIVFPEDGTEKAVIPEEAKDTAQLLYEVAAVASGYELPDPAAFAKRVVALMSEATVEDEAAPEPAAAAKAEEEAVAVEVVGAEDEDA